MKGYKTVESDSDSDVTWRVVSKMFVVGRDARRKGKEKEDSDDESDDWLCF